MDPAILASPYLGGLFMVQVIVWMFYTCYRFVSFYVEWDFEIFSRFYIEYEFYDLYDTFILYYFDNEKLNVWEKNKRLVKNIWNLCMLSSLGFWINRKNVDKKIRDGHDRLSNYINVIYLSKKDVISIAENLLNHHCSSKIN